MPENSLITGIIMAAGSSKRFGENKLMANLNNKPVLAYVIEEFEKSLFIKNIVIVTSETLKPALNSLIKSLNLTKNICLVNGGKTRQESVFNSLEHIKTSEIKCSYVVIHDGARPVITYKDIDKCLQGAVKFKATTLGIRPKDTIKQSDTPFSKTIISTPPRELLWLIQTPQAFEFKLIEEAHQLAKKDNFNTTDDCALVERIGINPVVIEGDYRNLKITTPEDIKIAELFLLQPEEKTNNKNR